MKHRKFVVAGLMGTLMCVAQTRARVTRQETVVFQKYRNDWYQGYFTPVALSQDTRWALFGRGPGNMHLYSLPAGNEARSSISADLDSLEDAAFCGHGNPGIAKLGRRGTEHGWFLPGDDSNRVSDIPATAKLACSIDGSTIAYFGGSHSSRPLHVGTYGHNHAYDTHGSVIAMAFSVDGKFLYHLDLDTEGQSTLSGISVETGTTRVIASRLDGTARGGTDRDLSRWQRCLCGPCLGERA